MPSALSCNGSRILTPAEASAIRSAIVRPSLRTVFDVMLYTGIRYAELAQVTPATFDPDRRVITIRSGKAKASQRYRNVRLCDKGIAAVAAYLEDGRRSPTARAWREDLINWSRSARLSPLPSSAAAGNPAGVTVRTSRKTLESWLLTAYPDRSAYITLSQGHTESTALVHYLNLSFTPAEASGIREEVSGWG